MISLGLIVAAIGLLVMLVGLFANQPQVAVAGRWVVGGGLVVVVVGLVILVLNRTATGDELEVDALRAVLHV